MSARRSYAVLELPEQNDVGQLFKLLMSNGYKNVTLVEELHEHPTVCAYIEERDRTKMIKGFPQMDAASQSSMFGNAESVIEFNDIEPMDYKRKPVASLHTHFNNNYGPMEDDNIQSPTAAVVKQEIIAPQPSTQEMTIGETLEFTDDEQCSSDGFSSSEGADVGGNSIRSKAPAKKSTQSINRLNRIGKVSKTVRNQKNMPVTCTVCHKLFPAVLRNAQKHLLRHAKNHCHLRQYGCPAKGCDYTSSEGANAGRHIERIHNMNIKPTDTITDELQQAWLESFKKCFPQLKHKTQTD